MKSGSGKLPGLLALMSTLLLILRVCFFQQVSAQTTSDIFWFEDASGKLTLDDILQQDTTTEWSKLEQTHLNFGFTRSVFWLNVPFENGQDIHQAMLLEVAFPLHDNIDVYLLDNNKLIKTYHTGDQHPFTSRPLNHRNFLFPYTTPPQKKLRAIVRLQSTDTMYLPVKVWTESNFFASDQHQMLLLGIFFGSLLIMLVYNWSLYITTRHKNYLNYVWYTAAIIYLQLTQKSLGYQYLWPEQPFFNHISVPLSSFILIATSCFFIINFLKLDINKYPKTVFTFNAFIWISLLGIISTSFLFAVNSTLISYTSILVITAVLGVIITVSAAFMLSKLALSGVRSAQILTIAWLFLLVGSLLFALGRIGTPIPMIITENAMLIGSTLEAALISLALARHIRKEREARLLAQELALQNERKTRDAQNSLLILQRKTTLQLEQRVKIRTQELETTMQSLQQANHKLKNLARVDGLTGLYNRREFDQEFERQWRNGTRKKCPVALMMADIDCFKGINDNYGHLFGDQCLINVAAILKHCVNRPEDLTARFGGEEFIILLPNTNTKEAGIIAEQIRLAVESLSLTHENQQIQFTISIGIASTVPKSGISCIDLIASADQALYLAKEAGRNRVVKLEMSAKKDQVTAEKSCAAQGTQSPLGNTAIIQ